ALSQTGYQATVDLDLARLANILPQTLHLQKDMRVTDGRLHLDLTAQSRDQQRYWSGRLDTSNLKGVNHGRAVALQAPLAVSFTVRKPVDSFPVVEQLRCDSSFLEMSVSGQQGSWTANVQFDLGQLAAQLSQFIDLGPMRLAGSGSTQVSLLLD